MGPRWLRTEEQEGHRRGVLHVRDPESSNVNSSPRGKVGTHFLIHSAFTKSPSETGPGLVLGSTTGMGNTLSPCPESGGEAG